MSAAAFFRSLSSSSRGGGDIGRRGEFLRGLLGRGDKGLSLRRACTIAWSALRCAGIAILASRSASGQPAGRRGFALGQDVGDRSNTEPPDQGRNTRKLSAATITQKKLMDRLRRRRRRRRSRNRRSGLSRQLCQGVHSTRSVTSALL